MDEEKALTKQLQGNFKSNKAQAEESLRQLTSIQNQLSSTQNQLKASESQAQFSQQLEEQLTAARHKLEETNKLYEDVKLQLESTKQDLASTKETLDNKLITARNRTERLQKKAREEANATLDLLEKKYQAQIAQVSSLLFDNPQLLKYTPANARGQICER